MKVHLSVRSRFPKTNMFVDARQHIRGRACLLLQYMSDIRTVTGTSMVKEITQVPHGKTHPDTSLNQRGESAALETHECSST